MKTPTVTLQHITKKNKRIKVDLAQYKHDLGKNVYKNYRLVGETRGGAEAESKPETSSKVEVKSETSGLAQVENTDSKPVETILTTTENESEKIEMSAISEPAASVDAVIESIDGSIVDLEAPPAGKSEGTDEAAGDVETDSGDQESPAEKPVRRGRPPKVSK